MQESRRLFSCLVFYSFGRLGDCPTRMPVQRGRDVHIWRLPSKNAVSRMAIYAKLYGNYMFYIHTNAHKLPTNFSQIFPSFCECLGTFSRFPIRQGWFFYLFPKRSVFLFSSITINKSVSILLSVVGIIKECRSLGDYLVVWFFIRLVV